MKKRQLTAAIMACAMVASGLIGCGSKSPETTAASTAATQETMKDTQAEDASAKNEESFTLSLATTQASNTDIVGIITEMADNIREESNGTIDIQIYPDSTMGGQNEYLEGVSMGTVDMCLIAAGAIEGFYNQYAVYSVPFLFKNVDHTYKFYESPDGQAINDEFLKRTNIRVVDCFDEGFRQVFANKPVKALADFAGLKIRIPDNPLYVTTFNSLGCSATVVPLGDLYTALQTGLVDSFELPTGSAYGNSVYEQVKYCTITNHIGGAMFVLVNDSVWNKLSDNQKAIISKYAKQASEKNRQNITAKDKEQWDAMKEYGIEFINLTDDAYNEIVDAMSGVVDEMYGNVLDIEMLDRARALD